jgi:hypothetical protein
MSKRPILLTTLAFAAIGPLIGALLVIALEIFYAFVNGTFGALTHDFMMFGLIVLAWAYALGCLPSAVMGFLWALFFARFQSRLSLTQRATSGVCLGIVVGTIAGLLWDWIASTSLERTRLIYLCTERSPGGRLARYAGEECRSEAEHVGLVVFAKEGVDDLDKSATFGASAASRRST